MHDVLCRDVQRGVEIGRPKVLHGSLRHDELARHRSDDQAIGATRCLQGATQEIRALDLVHPHGAGQLDVRFVGAQPDVFAHRQLQIAHLQTVEEQALELGAQPLHTDQRRVDQVLHPRLVEVHDALIYEVGEVQHARRDRTASGQCRAEHRAGQGHPAARGEREIAAQIQRLELGRRDVQREYRFGEPLQPHVAGQFRVALSARRGDAVHADRVAPQRQSTVHIRIAHVQCGNRGRCMADLETTPQLRRLPRAADAEIRGEDAFDLPHRCRDRREHAEIDAVGAGLHRQGVGQLPVGHRHEREIERQAGGDVQDLLSRPPQVHLAVQPVVAIVDDPVHKRRAERAERGIRECERAAIQRIRTRTAGGKGGGDGARDAQRVALRQGVNAGEREAVQRHPGVDRTMGREIAAEDETSCTRGIPEGRRIHVEHGIAERERRGTLEKPHAAWQQDGQRVHHGVLYSTPRRAGVAAAREKRPEVADARAGKPGE